MRPRGKSGTNFGELAGKIDPQTRKAEVSLTAEQTQQASDAAYSEL